MPFCLKKNVSNHWWQKSKASKWIVNGSMVAGHFHSKGSKLCGWQNSWHSWKVHSISPSNPRLLATQQPRWSRAVALFLSERWTLSAEWMGIVWSSLLDTAKLFSRSCMKPTQAWHGWRHLRNSLHALYSLWHGCVLSILSLDVLYCNWRIAQMFLEQDHLR